MVRQSIHLTAAALTAAIVISACGSDTSDGQADLVPLSVRQLHCPFACRPLRLEVCVANQGDADAGDFVVSVNGRDDAALDALAAGADACVDVVYTFGTPPAQPFVAVDSLDVIAESDESNNVATFPHPNGTACDLICEPLPTPLPGSG